MSYFLPTIIWRHRKENLKKCSLKNLEKRKDLLFFTYPKEELPNLDNYILLTLKAPILSEKDQGKGLFLIDATWKLSETMKKALPLNGKKLEMRSLPPNFKTAYPRKQTLCLDPTCGLASIEALFLAYLITQKDPQGLLDYYHFKDSFLKLNALS